MHTTLLVQILFVNKLQNTTRHLSILNFHVMVGQGAAQACNQLSVLQEFKSSSVVKVNPDKPQEQARYCTLEVSVTHLLLSLIL